MKKYFYPAIFKTNIDGGYVVTFPDLKGCVTEGDTTEEAFCNAEEAMIGWLASYLNRNDAPKATSATKIKLESDEQLHFIKTTELELAKATNVKVRKNVYIPQGLALEAEMKDINFSRVLTEALENVLK